MSFSSWLRNWKASLEHRSAQRPKRRFGRAIPRRKRKGFALALEQLETRLTPATLLVNTAVDGVNPSDGTLSLRDAISAINAGNANGLTAGEQSQVSGTFGSNDTIQFDNNLSGKTITLDGSALPSITQNITINGLGASNLVIDAQGQSGIFAINAGAKVSITGLTLEDGNAGSGNGGAIAMGSSRGGATLSLSSCTLSGNSASAGGGIYNYGGTLTVNKSTLSGNSATNDGGGIESIGNATLNASKLSDNKAVSNGGAIAEEYSSNLTVNTCTVSGNSAASTTSNNFYQGGGKVGGGGIYCYSGSYNITLTVNSSTIQDNSTQLFGGGIFGWGSSVTVNSSTVQGNTAAGVGFVDGGGGIENIGSLTLSNSTVAGNQATAGVGGGIDAAGSLIVTNSTFSANSAQGGLGDGIFGGGSITSSTFTDNSGSGGVLFNTGGGNTLTVSDCTISDNSDGAIGTWASLVVSNCIISGNTKGGIGTDGGTVTISDSTISNNSGSQFGSSGIDNEGGGTITVSGCTISGNSGNVGGIYNAATMTVTDTSIYGNSGNGGGILNVGTLTVSDSSIYDNNSTGYGGGIFNGGTLTVANSTIEGNSAPAGGGGIENTGTLTATNCTIADNSAEGGGGILNQSSATLNNTIVADNTAGGDLGPYDGYSGSNDLIGDGSYLSSFSDSLSGNPLLAPLGNYGGPLVGAPGNQQVLQTMALLPGSPAIDAGSNALAVDADGNPLTTDQLGQPRIVNGTVDIGAFEVQITATASLSGLVFDDFNGDGQVDFGEKGISGVTITLTGTDALGQAVNQTQITDSDGTYMFLNLRPGNYYLTETQPTGYQQGIDTVGTAGGNLTATDQFFVSLGQGINGLNYNFGEQPAAGGAVQAGQTASIGFWNNKNGQALIKSFNGSATSTQLGDWLAATLPHMFGVDAGNNDLAGKSNTDIAALFQSDFLLKGVKLDAQVLATALSVYATNATLDNTDAAANYGFVISGDGLGTATVNVGSNGVAFGVANNTALTVVDLLKAADAQAVGGLLYNGDATLRKEANNVYSLINEEGDIG